MLSGNAITALPSGLGALGRLEVLDVAGNRITELPADCGALHCQELVLSRNQLPVGHCRLRRGASGL